MASVIFVPLLIYAVVLAVNGACNRCRETRALTHTLHRAPAIELNCVVDGASVLAHATYVMTSVHPHRLHLIHRQGWRCNGADLVGGCHRGGDGRGTQGLPRFHCQNCNFDLCAPCKDAYVIHDPPSLLPVSPVMPADHSSAAAVVHLQVRCKSPRSRAWFCLVCVLIGQFDF
jgi:hypothetical protein